MKICTLKEILIIKGGTGCMCYSVKTRGLAIYAEDSTRCRERCCGGFGGTIYKYWKWNEGPLNECYESIL